jgi:hypothetical protein
LRVISDHVWETEELAALPEAEERKVIDNGTMKRGKYKAKASE